MNEDWSGPGRRERCGISPPETRGVSSTARTRHDAAEQFRQLGINVDFVLLLHGHATQFAARTLSGTKFEAPDAPDLSPIHACLQRFSEIGGRMRCRIALERSGHRARQRHRVRSRGAQRVREFGGTAEPWLRLHADHLTRAGEGSGGRLATMKAAGRCKLGHASRSVWNYLAMSCLWRRP